ncbi:MAG TPA: hypothetical protein DDY78_26845 [Planctomycetales bacterium]|jgi:hypothetical protein|nr:hypothetical protein [Planctomycetales bacterium]
MKYFTRERYLAFQNFDDAAMDAADDEWENATDRYEAYLQTIRPDMPESVRQLEDGFYFHDARVLSMGRRDETFVISLQLDVPPNELLTITYALAGSPEVNKEPFADGKDTPSPWWLYEEIEQVGAGDRKHFVHSILFSNGWEISLPFSDVQVSRAEPVYPLPGTVFVPASTPAVAPSA